MALRTDLDFFLRRSLYTALRIAGLTVYSPDNIHAFIEQNRQTFIAIRSFPARLFLCYFFSPGYVIRCRPMAGFTGNTYFRPVGSKCIGRTIVVFLQIG